MSLAAVPLRSPVMLTDDELRADLRALVAELGLAAASRELGMTREPLARELAGIPTRNGTRALLRERLSARRSR